jgi:predicted CoA-binding protein
MSIEKDVLNIGKIVAVVGLSPDSTRPSFRVADYLKRQGYTIVPVNPAVGEIMGEKCYPDLSSIEGKVDIVDIFRRSEAVEPIVEEAIKIGAKAVWMQEGIVNEKAAQTAKEAGLLVVMDRCMLKEHMKLHQNA